jgi:hypothetical protein
MFDAKSMLKHNINEIELSIYKFLGPQILSEKATCRPQTSPLSISVQTDTKAFSFWRVTYTNVALWLEVNAQFIPFPLKLLLQTNSACFMNLNLSKELMSVN